MSGCSKKAAPGGLNTTLHAAVDGRCQPQSLILTAGTEADVAHAPALLKNLDAKAVILDKAFDSDALRDLITQANMKASIPPRKGRLALSAYDKELYKQRHPVENLSEKIKRMRHIATRHDKTDTSYMAFVLAGICTLFFKNQF